MPKSLDSSLQRLAAAGALAGDVLYCHWAMRNRANTKLILARAISAAALILVLGFAPAACAAMASQLHGHAHPCCPKPGHADSDPCAKTGCISNVPALRAAPVDFGVDMPAVVGLATAPPAATFKPERASEAALLPTSSQLFLINHSLLI